jgi:hypothetical protein
MLRRGGQACLAKMVVVHAGSDLRTSSTPQCWGESYIRRRIQWSRARGCSVVARVYAVGHGTQRAFSIVIVLVTAMG